MISEVKIVKKGKTSLLVFLPFVKILSITKEKLFKKTIHKQIFIALGDRLKEGEFPYLNLDHFKEEILK